MRRLLRWVSFLFVLMPLTLSLALYFLLAMPSFQKELTQHVEALLTEQTGLCFKIRQITYQLPFQVIFHDVSCGVSKETSIQLSRLALSFSSAEIFSKHFTTGHISAEIGVISLAASFEMKPDHAFHLKLEEIPDAFYSLYGELHLSATQELEGTHLYLKMPPFQSSDISFENGIEADLVAAGTLSTPLASAKCVAKKLSFNGVNIENLFAYVSLNSRGTLNVSVIAAKEKQKIEFSTNFKILLYSDPHQEHSFSFTLSGNGEEEVAVQSIGSWNMNSSSLHLYISFLQGKSALFPFTLLNSPLFVIGPTSIQTSLFIFQTGSGIIEGELNLSFTDLKGEIRLKQFPLHLLQKGSEPLPITALISGEALLSGSPEEPEIAMKMHFDSLTIQNNEFHGLPKFSADITGTLSKELGTISGIFNTEGQPAIQCQATLPIACTFSPLQFHLNPQAPLSAHFSLSGEIEPIIRLLFDDAINLTGNVNTHLTLSGSIDQPEFSGECEIHEGTFELPSTGALFSHLNAKLTAKGTDVSLEKFNAVDQNEGTISGSGNIQVNSPYPFSIDLILTKIRLLDIDYLQTHCSGSLNLTGDKTHANVSGTVQVDDALFTISDKKGGGIDTVDVTYVNLIKEEPAPQMLEHSTASWPVNLDLILNIPKTARIQGSDLTSTWKGELNIRGSAKRPLFFGQLKVEEGQYLFNGKPFAIRQGTITMAGEPERKTVLYVIASKDLEKVKIDLIFKGNVKRPSVSFRSNPPLPQREILSWLLFNQGAMEISPFQGRQLNETITNLDSTHKTNGLDILTKIKNSLGIDRFEIGRDEHNGNNQMSLEVGKYISENFYISINKSDVNRLAIEAALSDKVKIQAEISDDAEGQFLLKWKRDY
jgi:translocation and assembly module TamB